MEATKCCVITIAVAALTLSLGGPCRAANLSAPFSLENTQTLPAGVRNPRFINVLTQMDTKFDENGGLEPLGDRLNKRISWNDVLDAQSDDTQRNIVKGVLADRGLSLDGTPGNATGVVHTYANIKVPVLAAGLTERLTFGVAVPIVHIDVAVDKGFMRSEDGQAFVSHLCETSPDKCNEAATKLNSATDRKLERLGYLPMNNHTVSSIGDIQLLGRYRWLGDTEQGLATKLTVVLPTGTRTNPDMALNPTTGDGRFKVGAAVVYDRFLLGGRLRWNTHAGYTALLPSREVKRLPTSADDSLSADKEELTRRWGDQVMVGTALEMPIPAAGLVLASGLSSQYLSKTRWSGTASDVATQTRYRLLEDLEPTQVLHAVTASVGFSTVQWYREKAFPLPFQLNAVYSHPLGGRNGPRHDIMAGEMVMFF